MHETEQDLGPLVRAAADLRDRLAAGESPAAVAAGDRTVAIDYDEDECGEFARIALSLPDGVLAEIEDRTFGELLALRVYFS